ncbi:hypothetical protein [Desulfobacter curvatus]|uniref:hypothetical protein n=1 Tax=Desulfobacter curvatus TaxID=2290 RepID=UPI0012FA290C|nr:hypothetical protein [Desulfobacter curvatus]
MSETKHTVFYTSKGKAFETVVALFCFVVIIFVTLSIFSIFRNRQSYLNEARIRSIAQAQLLAENSTSVLYAVDLMLLPLRSIIQHQSNLSHLPSIDADAIEIFEPELRLLPQIKDVVLLDSKAAVIYSSQRSKEFEIPTFADHRDAWLEFSIDSVIVGKDNAKIVLSRRIENQKNEFLGVLGAVVDPDYFYDRFSDYLDVDMEGIALVDIKGMVLTGWFRETNPEDKFIGANIRDLPYFSSFSKTLLSSGGRATYEDGTTIVSTHQLQGFPFHVAVSYSQKNVLKKWRKEAVRDMATIFFTTLIAAFTLTIAHRHRQRRKKAEMKLYAHHERLEKTVAERTELLTETNRELIQKNAALKNALAEVKALSGLLPICAHCKKIRDDKGYWNQLEAYLSKHSDITLSHGICPECLKEHYPDYVKQ